MLKINFTSGSWDINVSVCTKNNTYNPGTQVAGSVKLGERWLFLSAECADSLTVSQTDFNSSRPRSVEA